MGDESWDAAATYARKLVTSGRTASAKDLTEEELERLLAEKRLTREQSLITNGESSRTNTIIASETCTCAVGSTLEVDIATEGVSVRALIDTGAQSTIISRATLHKVAQRLKQQGSPPLSQR